MAWLEPFFAALPQWVSAARNKPIFSALEDDEANLYHPIEIELRESGSPMNDMSNMNAIAMYQRAVVLQNLNSETMNQQIFSPSFEPIMSSSNHLSDFESEVLCI